MPYRGASRGGLFPSSSASAPEQLPQNPSHRFEEPAEAEAASATPKPGRYHAPSQRSSSCCFLQVVGLVPRDNRTCENMPPLLFRGSAWIFCAEVDATTCRLQLIPEVPVRRGVHSIAGAFEPMSVRPTTQRSRGGVRPRPIHRSLRGHGAPSSLPCLEPLVGYRLKSILSPPVALPMRDGR